MKQHSIIAIVLLFMYTHSYSQSIEKFSIDSGGDSTNSGSIQLLYTIGEVNVQESSVGNVTVSEGFINASLRIQVSPLVFLQGPILNPNTAGLMNDNLRTASYIPTISPYEDAASCDVSVFNVTGNNAIVDWVFIELRDVITNTTVLRSQSALIQRDGDIVAVDGVSELEFNVPPGNYHIAVKHRNHLGIMTSTPVTLSNAITIIDFTNSNNQITFGTNAQTTFGMPSGRIGMWTGNVNGDAIVQYSGTNPDTPAILSKVLNDPANFLNFPTFTVIGYNVEDINMDGNTQYSGTMPDTPLILQNVLAHPGNFLNFSTYQIQEQLPEN